MCTGLLPPGANPIAVKILIIIIIIIQHTAYSTQYTVHSIQYTVYSTQHTVHSIHILQSYKFYINYSIKY